MQNYAAPAVKLSTSKGMWKTILLGLITFGIYPLVIYTELGNDVNTVATKSDGKKTMNYLLMFFIIAPLTCGIAPIVWFHRVSNRIGDELRRRGVAYSFGASDYWLWNVLGSFIFVGPFVYMHKLLTACNLMNGDYNAKG